MNTCNSAIDCVSSSNIEVVRSSLASLAIKTGAHIETANYGSESDRRLAVSFAEQLIALNTTGLEARFPVERSVRALRFAPSVFGANDVGDELAPLHDAALGAFPHVRWTEFYAEDDWSRGFLPNFANGEGIGPDGRLIHDSLILGLFLLGPDTLYPAHAHPAEEFYVIVSGGADFSIGANEPYRHYAPGSVALHHANVSHSIRTGKAPLFAVFGWQGSINEASWYRDDMSDTTLPVRYPQIAKS